MIKMHNLFCPICKIIVVCIFLFIYYFRHGMIKTLVTVYRINGVTNGLYRGMSINFIRAVPMVAVSFSTYELMKQTLNLDTGVDS